ncbi:LysM peptidoglycan-binding domain-containing protein [Flavobacterium sp.]|uniref:LysM peptidoglycan-binding domain-containing protein n=1 Tax=Flavobacterium sp. TaxID=239 RepID=UPI003BBC205B
MLKRFIYIFVFLISASNFGQNYTKHSVAKGETISSIAQKYRVTPYEIYKLNPDSQNGIKENSVLLIPSNITHSASTSNSQRLTTSNKITNYVVVSGDTKYNIAKKFSISVEELENQNPEIKENLPLGFSLKIKSGTALSVPPKVISDIPKPQVKSSNLLEYTVKQGETLYSLTHLFNVPEATLINLNPDLKDGVKEGMVLKVSSNLSFAKETKNGFKDLSKSISSQQKKQLVLFLPFNVSKIQNDSVTSVSERLKKDKFLNMTLDFYSGALMAIDSAKVIGLNMEVKIYDSEETKSTTSALSIISGSDFANTDAVIGPFYQVNVEKVAAVLENQNIPVISPLSKDEGKSFKNLYQSMPQNEAIKNALFDYMHSKNGNIIAIVDPKKMAIKQYLQDFQKDVKLVGVNDKGGFVADSIKKYFVKNRINYVILASEKTGVIISVTTSMQSAMKEYQVQLVILEPNETLDFEEIALSRLTKLKMAFPSVSKENETEEAQQFAVAYKKKNRIFPNQYAIRGFDLTFDTMLRLSKGQTFEDSVNANASVQIESKFDYVKKLSGGYINNGVFILYYDEDLTIKQAQ